MDSYPPPSLEYQKHVENRREVRLAMTQLERAHKETIRRRDEAGEVAFRRLHILLLGVYAESALRAIIFDPAGLNLAERQQVWSKPAQDQRWVETVRISADRASAKVPEFSGHHAAQVEFVKQLLKNHLGPYITDRNKLAHGQWIHQLKSHDEESFLAESCSYQDNYWGLRAKYRLIQAICELVELLCKSPATFVRDFARIEESIALAVSQSDGHEYSTHAQVMRSKRRD